MKPKPFSSLNHFTVPVGMYCSSADMCCERGGCKTATTASAGTICQASWPGRYRATVAAAKAARWVCGLDVRALSNGAVEFRSSRRGRPLRTRRENGCPPLLVTGAVERWYGARRSQDGSERRPRRRRRWPKAIDQRPGGEADGAEGAG